MSKENHLENIWRFMKDKGYYSEFDDYESWRADKYKTETESKTDYDKFLEELSPEEKEEYDKTFN